MDRELLRLATEYSELLDHPLKVEPEPDLDPDSLSAAKAATRLAGEPVREAANPIPAGHTQTDY